jgi:predicted small secreted protein
MLALDDGRKISYASAMKTTKSAILLLALGVLLSGCASTDGNGVNITHGSIMDILWNQPAPVPASPVTPNNPAPAPQVPANAPPAQPLASN